MSDRELVVLGTSSQVPTRHRNHNGYFLRWDDIGLLIDPGEGTQRQMTRYGVSASQIDAILVTHFHGDHCLGLASMVQRISLDGVPKPVHVLYPASGENYYQRLRHASIFHDRAQTIPVPLSEDGPCMEWERQTLSARRLDHTVDCFGWRLEERARWICDPRRLEALGLAGPVVGELLREGSIEHQGRRVQRDEVASLRPGQVFAFVMDTRVCAAAVELARGADLLVCESTFLESEAAEAAEYGHLTAGQAARIAAEAGARRLVLTHFSQRHRELEAFRREASAHHGDVHTVQDGDRIPVPSRQSEA